jgi:hypothetical protein
MKKKPEDIDDVNEIKKNKILNEIIQIDEDLVTDPNDSRAKVKRRQLLRDLEEIKDSKFSIPHLDESDVEHKKIEKIITEARLPKNTKKIGRTKNNLLRSQKDTEIILSKMTKDKLVQSMEISLSNNGRLWDAAMINIPKPSKEECKTYVFWYCDGQIIEYNRLIKSLNAIQWINCKENLRSISIMIKKRNETFIGVLPQKDSFNVISNRLKSLNSFIDKMQISLISIPNSEYPFYKDGLIKRVEALIKELQNTANKASLYTEN